MHTEVRRRKEDGVRAAVLEERKGDIYDSSVLLQQKQTLSFDQLQFLKCEKQIGPKEKGLQSLVPVSTGRPAVPHFVQQDFVLDQFNTVRCI